MHARGRPPPVSSCLDVPPERGEPFLVILVTVLEQVDGFRELLQSILSVNLTQNEEVKKTSAWAAIPFVQTLIGTVYGMNFDHMPELHWTLGYPFAPVLPVSVSLYLIFRSRGWL